MAKPARSVEVDFNPKATAKDLSAILARYDNIESARGKFMNLARREREGMTATLEMMATRGISQKSAKTEIKIIRALERIRGWFADLEAEDRKMVQRLAKLRDDRMQIPLFADLPKEPKPAKAPKQRGQPARLELVEPQPAA